ncbi:MAG: hypothetical protein ACJ8AE_09550, partial [Gemmatimonadaceae bacterium]
MAFSIHTNGATRLRLPILLFTLALFGCSNSHDSSQDTTATTTSAPHVGRQLFTRMPSSYTGVRFA